jgi:3-oxoacyl-[acyl-carrier protein] reductase
VYAEVGLAAYGASKPALISLLETVNAEESGSGVTATALAPGYARTDMSAWVTGTVPVDSMIPVDDVVRVVDPLLSLAAATSVSMMVLSPDPPMSLCRWGD